MHSPRGRGSPAPAGRSTGKATPKLKNKLAPKTASSHPKSKTKSSDVEYSSDKFDLCQEEDISVQAESSSETTVGDGRRHRLPWHVQCQLLIDIQLKGGIDNYHLLAEQALCGICDQRPELYGTCGDPLRARIHKKITGWKKQKNTQRRRTMVCTVGIFDIDTKTELAKQQRVGQLKRTDSDLSETEPEPEPERVARRIPTTVSIPGSASVISVPSTPVTAKKVIDAPVTSAKIVIDPEVARRMSNNSNTRKFTLMSLFLPCPVSNQQFSPSCHHCGSSTTRVSWAIPSLLCVRLRCS